MSRVRHRSANQKNYNKNANGHNNALDLNSTLYLAYRDLPTLLDKHLFKRTDKPTYRVLDFGCGTGFSSKQVKTICTKAGKKVEIIGVDISQANLDLACTTVPDATFIMIKPEDSLDFLANENKIDLIICNFVLLEMPTAEMATLLKKLQALLSTTGMMIATNYTPHFYDHKYSWVAVNNNFSENLPRDPLTNELADDQPVKSQSINSKQKKGFIFCDFFHPQQVYKSTYENAGLELMQNHQPLGKPTDAIKWKSEAKLSPISIHVLYKSEQPELDKNHTEKRSPRC